MQTLGVEVAVQGNAAHLVTPLQFRISDATCQHHLQSSSRKSSPCPVRLLKMACQESGIWRPLQTALWARPGLGSVLRNDAQSLMIALAW